MQQISDIEYYSFFRINLMTPTPHLFENDRESSGGRGQLPFAQLYQAHVAAKTGLR